MQIHAMRAAPGHGHGGASWRRPPASSCPPYSAFPLLRAIGTHCFQALIQLSIQQLKLAVDSINWAFRHTERNIAEIGLSLLLEILKNFQASGFHNKFYKTYFLMIEQEIFAVLTDKFHKPGFKLVLVLQHFVLCGGWSNRASVGCQFSTISIYG